MKNNLFYYVLLMVFMGCSQQPNLEPDQPKITMVSTFDVALNSKSQLELESEFDNW